MNYDGSDFLNSEYCFAGGTFKRCPGFVTLSAFVYVTLLKKIVKLCTMEVESESVEIGQYFGIYSIKFCRTIEKNQFCLIQKTGA